MSESLEYKLRQFASHLRANSRQGMESVEAELMEAAALELARLREFEWMYCELSK